MWYSCSFCPSGFICSSLYPFLVMLSRFHEEKPPREQKLQKRTHQNQQCMCNHLKAFLQTERKAIRVIRSLRISGAQQEVHAQQWHRWRRRRRALDSMCASPPCKMRMT